MPDHPYTRLYMESHAGSFIGFDVVDWEAPYARRVLGKPRAEDAGRWSDLEPDLPRQPAEGENAVALLSRHARDGGIRAALMEQGISNAQWEAASPSERERVKAALRAVEAVGDAVRAVLTHHDKRLRSSGLKLLHKVANVVESDQHLANTRGHFRFQSDSDLILRGRNRLRLAKELLKRIKAEQRESVGASPADKKELRARHMKRLSELGVGLKFKEKHLNLLEVQSVGELATDVVLETFPALTRRKLTAGVRRQGAKRRKKGRVTGSPTKP